MNKNSVSTMLKHLLKEDRKNAEKALSNILSKNFIKEEPKVKSREESDQTST